MDKDIHLKWNKTTEEIIAHTPVYDVIKQHEVSNTGIEGDYIATSCRDWAVIIPVIEDSFLMVRQWRHASESITLEFPGGVCDFGEEPLKSAARELEEETGYHPNKVSYLGSFSPNPALFRNRVHCYLAEDLVNTGVQHLDADEVLEFSLVPIDDILSNLGNSEFDHALMASALALYLSKVRG